MRAVSEEPRALKSQRVRLRAAKQGGSSAEIRAGRLTRARLARVFLIRALP